MGIIDRKDKYCLKGEYYSTLEEINVRLRFSIPNFFRKEVYLDLIDLFYRNQSMGKPISQVLIGGIDKFVADITESFYSTLSIGMLIRYLFRSAILFSLCTESLYIINSIVVKSSKAISFAVIIIGIIGFVLGILNFYCNYALVYKFQGVKRKVIQIVLILTPIYMVNFFGELIYDLTKDIIISEKVIILIILVQIAIYTLDIFSKKIRRKSE